MLSTRDNSRNSRTVAVVCSVLAVMLAHTPPLDAACGTQPLSRYLDHPDVAVIFRGTVTKVTDIPETTIPLGPTRGPLFGQIGAMRVTRVWKGSVPAETVLHFRFGEGRYGLEVGRDYLVIAHQLSRDGRHQFGLSVEGERAFGTNELGCGAILFDSPSIIKILGTDSGYSPQ